VSAIQRLAAAAVPAPPMAASRALGARHALDCRPRDQRAQLRSRPKFLYCVKRSPLTAGAALQTQLHRNPSELPGESI
jgi:hypothetical protein